MQELKYLDFSWRQIPDIYAPNVGIISKVYIHVYLESNTKVYLVTLDACNIINVQLES